MRIFFCEDESSRVKDGIQFYSLATAFEKFTATSQGKAWLSIVRQ